MSSPLVDISNSSRYRDNDQNINIAIEHTTNTKRRKRCSTPAPHVVTNSSSSSLLNHLAPDELFGILYPLLPQIEATFNMAIVERFRLRCQWRSPPPFVLDCVAVFLDVSHRLRLRSVCREYYEQFRLNTELWRGTRLRIKRGHVSELNVMLPRLNIHALCMSTTTKQVALNAINMIAPLSSIRSLTLTSVNEMSMSALLSLRHINELKLWRTRISRSNTGNLNEQSVLPALTYFHFTESVEADDRVDEKASEILRILPQTLLSLEVRYYPRPHDQELLKKQLPNLTYLDVSLQGSINHRSQRDVTIPLNSPLKHIALTQAMTASTLQQLCDIDSLVSLHTQSQTIHIARPIFIQFSHLQELSIEHDDANMQQDWSHLQVLHALRILRWKSYLPSATEAFIKAIVDDTDGLHHPLCLMTRVGDNNPVVLQLDMSQCDNVTHKTQLFYPLLSRPNIISRLHARLHFVALPLYTRCSEDDIDRFRQSGLTILKTAPASIVRRCGCTHARDCDHLSYIEQSPSK